MMNSASNAYTEKADVYFSTYRSVKTEDVLRDSLGYIPSNPGIVLDVGSGSGRDSIWLAEKGHTVISVEPSVGLRELAIAGGLPHNIVYFDTSLPVLSGLDAFVRGFDFILCSAVLMHLDEEQRHQAAKRFWTLLKPGCRAVVIYKVAPAEPDRLMYHIDKEDIELAFAKAGFEIDLNVASGDLLGRSDTVWYTAVFRKPSF